MALIALARSQKPDDKEQSEPKRSDCHRFWWTGTEWEAAAFTEALLDDERFRERIIRFLNTPDTCKGELEYDIQSLCESIDEASRRHE